MANPFLPLVKNIMSQMDLNPKVPKKPNEILGDKILNTIWDDIEPTQKEEYEMFYSSVQSTIWDICKSEQRLVKITRILVEYLSNKEK